MVSVGREVQARIYRDGLFGIKRAVPVAPQALKAAARRTMSPAAWSYVAGSAGAEATARANRQAFERHHIVPRILRNVETRDVSIDLLGRRNASPFLLCPIGVLELAHPGADVAAARAAASQGIPMVQSTQASHSMEHVAAQTDGPRWFQLYWGSNPDLVASMLSRAERSGCEAIVVTLDTHLLGWRPRDLDRAFLPFAIGQGIAQYTSDPVFAELVESRVRRGAPARSGKVSLTAVRSLLSLGGNYPGSTFANLRSPYPRAAVETFLEVFSRSSLTWDDLTTLREHTSLPILLKGVLHHDDARRAVDAGVDGLIVSNHGGRQVDGALAALDALTQVAAEVRGRLPVVFDSGVRGGADAFKALALGATAVGIGRPYVYGLALAGERGVREVIENFAAEFDLTMALAGCRNVSEITADLLTA